MSDDGIKFWSLADGKHLMVPASQCQLETVKTAKGERKRLSALVTTDEGKERKLSKFVAKDFSL